MKTWEVVSDSDAGRTYTVTWHEDENRWDCTCPASKVCKHILRLQSQVVMGAAAAPVESLDEAWGSLVGRGLVKAGEPVTAVHPPLNQLPPGYGPSYGPIYPEFKPEDHVVPESPELSYEPEEVEPPAPVPAEVLQLAEEAARELRPGEPPVKNIDEAIAAVYAEVDYVQKKVSKGLDYSFAGEAAIINVVRPAMVRHGITVHVAKVKKPIRVEYVNKSQTRMVNTILKVQVVFTHAPSGTKRKVWAWGEGSDSGDKGIPKAHTGAFKYAIRQTFALETGDDPDKTSSREYEGGGQRSPEAQEARENRQARRDVLTDRGGAGRPPAWWDFFIKTRNSLGLTGGDLEPVLHGACTPANVNRYLDSQEQPMTSPEDLTAALNTLLSRAADWKAKKEGEIKR